MNFKRIGCTVVAFALSVSCMALPIAYAFQQNEGLTPREILTAKFESEENPALTADEREELVNKLLDAFGAGDFTELTFYERTAVFDDGLFEQYLTDTGMSKRQKASLRKARTGAFDIVEVERNIDYGDWLDSADFSAYLASSNLTGEQQAALAEARPVFNDSTMLNAYLRQLGVDDKGRDEFRAGLHQAYESARYGGLTAPVGYDTLDFQFDAFVDMLESGDFDKLLAKRDKNGKFSAEDKLELAEKFTAFFDIDEADVWAGMCTRFAELSEAE